MEERRFDLTEWLENKRNRTGALIIIIVLLGLTLVVRMFSHVKGIGEESKLPDSGLMAEKGDYVERELPYYLSSSVSNQSLGVTIALPSGMGELGEYLTCEIGDVIYIVGDISQGVDELSKNLYKEVVKSVWGTKDKVKVLSTQSGYIGSMAADFCAVSVDMQISTRETTIYSIAYGVSVQDVSGVTGRQLLLYACSEKPEALDEAQVVLKEIAHSTRKIDLSLFEQKEEDKSDRPLGTEYFFPIDVYYTDTSTGYAQTVMLVEWDNLYDEPGELIVTGPDGQIGILNEEYSSGGHYLYEFGVTGGGEYYLHGGTDKKLTGASILVTSMETYMELYHYYEIHDEVPDYIENRPDEEEDY